MDPRRREIYMGIPAVRGEKENSYEEQRVADYIKAFIATGRPPIPCPQTPTSATERIALGLPPLFQPHVEVPGAREPSPTASISPAASSTTLFSSTSVSNHVPPTSETRDPHLLPQVQSFSPVAINEGSRDPSYFQSIVCHATYIQFSPEELRYQAYLSGNKVAPDAISPSNSISTSEQQQPQQHQQQPQTQPQPHIEQPMTNGYMAERFQSICCTPAFAQHSFEELRLACIRFGREISSEEITRHRVSLKLN